MTRKTTASRILGLFDDLGAAFAVAGAVRNHRQPERRHLERLGIDAEQFARIGK